MYRLQYQENNDKRKQVSYCSKIKYLNKIQKVNYYVGIIIKETKHAT